MTNKVDSIRLFLSTCSGEDSYIISRCSKPIQISFALIGFFVLTIFFGCFISASFFSYSVFEEAKWVSFPIGIFWGAIITNIYLLLLYTITPKLLPVAKPKKKQIKVTSGYFLTSSMLFRLGFMMLLAIIIAQPLNVELIGGSVSNSLESHKKKLNIQNYISSNEKLFQEELSQFKELKKYLKYRIDSNDSLVFNNTIYTKVKSDINFIKTSKKLLKELLQSDNLKAIKSKEIIEYNLNILYNNQLSSDIEYSNSIQYINLSNLLLKPQFDKYKIDLSTIINHRIENQNKFQYLIDKSNFYVKTIQLLLNENILSWLITLIVCFLFLLPIYLKYKVRDLSKSFFDKDFKNNSNIKRVRNEILEPKNFKWLAEKIKSLPISDFQTSDYYFKRMIIEHRIILEEYDRTNAIYSKILTEKSNLLNYKSINTLNVLLDKLKKINFSKYEEFKKQINSEYNFDVITRYEYSENPPFRTIKRIISSVNNNEADLLELIYQDNTIVEN